MKKIGKLSISPEKIMKNEELINLQGGYGKNHCCFCGGIFAMGAVDNEECQYNCMNEMGVDGEWVCDV